MDDDFIKKLRLIRAEVIKPDDADDDFGPLPEVQAIAQVEMLRETFKLWSEKQPFKLGDLVTLDPIIGNNYRVPRVNQPALVVEVLDTPIRDTSSESGNQHFNQPFDTRVMLFISGRCIHHWYYHKELIHWDMKA